MINLLTSKMFHDIGNAIVPLNFFIELNCDNPSDLDFQELIAINRQMILNLNVLKYAFLKDEYGEKALNDLVEYFKQKNKKLEFSIDHFEFNQDYFVLMVHILMILSKGDNSEIFVSYNDGLLRVRCENSSTERLQIDLDVESDIHIIYIKSALKRLDSRLSYKVISSKEFIIEVAQVS